MLDSTSTTNVRTGFHPFVTGYVRVAAYIIGSPKTATMGIVRAGTRDHWTTPAALRATFRR